VSHSLPMANDDDAEIQRYKNSRRMSSTPVILGMILNIDCMLSQEYQQQPYHHKITGPLVVLLSLIRLLFKNAQYLFQWNLTIISNLLWILVFRRKTQHFLSQCYAALFTALSHIFFSSSFISSFLLQRFV